MVCPYVIVAREVGGDATYSWGELRVGETVVFQVSSQVQRGDTTVELTGPIEAKLFDKAGQTTGNFDAEIVSMTLTSFCRLVALVSSAIPPSAELWPAPNPSPAPRRMLQP